MPRERQMARREVITLPIGDGALTAAAEKCGWEAQFPGVLEEAELMLRSTGATSGNTDVDVKKNGTSVLAAPGLRIAQGATTKRVRVKPTVGVGGLPNGVKFKKGDYLSADVNAIPGTASQGGVVFLYLRPTDI